MFNNTTECPSDEDIRSYLAGLLSEECTANFELHAAVCGGCESRIVSAFEASEVPEWLSLARTFKNSQPPHPEGIGIPGSIKRASVRYSWTRCVGAGGMGEVWEGWDHLMQRSVALKQLRIAGTSLNGAQRLLREAAILARLTHPRIVSVFEIIADQQQPILVMEYVPGMTLTKWQKGQPLSEHDAARITYAIANALHHAHSHKIVHRDLKPSNILIKNANSGVLPFDVNGEADIKLSDFGLARYIDSEFVTRSGQIIGTPHYIAPEQISQPATVDARADIYSAGVVLYEMLTGRPPFAAYELTAVISMIQSQDPVAPRRLQPHLSRDIETICLKCLARNPAERYQTALQLAADVAAFLDRRPIQARPLSVGRKVLRWTSKHRTLTGLLVLTAAAFVAAMTANLQSAAMARRLAAEQEDSNNRLRARLMDAIAIVDSYVKSVGNPGTPAKLPDAESRRRANQMATSVYVEYLRAIDLNQPLSWDDLDILVRYLSLRRFNLEVNGLEREIAVFDSSVKRFQDDPPDPLRLIEWIRSRQLFFDTRLTIDEGIAGACREWLDQAERFLNAARTTTDGERRNTLLEARRIALQEALNNASTMPSGEYSINSLREVVAAAKRPIPDAKSQSIGEPIVYVRTLARLAKVLSSADQKVDASKALGEAMDVIDRLFSAPLSGEVQACQAELESLSSSLGSNR